MIKNKQSYIFKTSGSTGEPKVIQKSYECLQREATDLAEFFNFSSDTVFVTTVSDNYMYGTTFTVMLPQILGCKVEERIVYPEDIKDYEKFVFVSTPSFLEKLAKYNYIFKHKPEMIISAGSKLDDNVFKYLEKISKKVTEIYGSTEAGVIAYRQKYNEKFRFFENVKLISKGFVSFETSGTHQKLSSQASIISSPYFDEPKLELDDNLEFFDDLFIVKQRNDRIVKIQEKRTSLDEIERILDTNNLIEKSYCLKLDDKLCAAVILNNNGRKFLEKNGKLELTKIIKKSTYFSNSEANKTQNNNTTFIFPKKWRFLTNLPINNRGKIDKARIEEWFSTDITYPNIVGFMCSAQKVEIDLIFPKNSNFFKGHFPDFPILPGVVQLFFAKEFAKDVFNLDFIPKQVKKIKFSSIIKPEMRVKLILTQNIKSIDYKYTDGEKTFSSGTFVL